MNDPSGDSRARSVDFSPIGRVLSPFDGKFGAPRQPGLVPAAIARIVFFAPWDHPDAFRGLEGFSHLWVLFLAHEIPAKRAPSLTVRPPRLGGNTRLGVFATRSLFRPNPLGLSLVELRAIQMENGSVSLEIAGADLTNDTPVLDVKPYLPYVEARPEARGGFASSSPDPIPVNLSPRAEAWLASREADRPGFRLLLLETLAADPRPAYQGETRDREYAFELEGVRVRFTAASGGGLFVLSLTDTI